MHQRSLTQFFRLTFALSWGLGGIYLAARLMWRNLAPLNASNPVFVVINCAPSLAALILTGLEGGRSGLRAMAAQTFRNFRLSACIVATIALPLLVCILSFIHLALHASWPVKPHDAFVTMPILLCTTPLLFSNVAPIGEEYGWRGFALPLLLQRYPQFAASVFLGMAWVLWHIPAFVLGGIMAVSFAGLLWWALATLGLSLFMTTLYVRGGRNVFIAGIAPHAIIDALGARGFWLDRPAEAVALSLCGVGSWLIARRRDVNRPPRPAN